MLTDVDCRSATCPPDRRCVRLTDAGGLFLEVTPNGSKRWFWRFPMAGKVRALPLGNYCKPGSKVVLVSLKAARLARDKARAEQQAGFDPIQQRRAERAEKARTAAVTYEAVAREFHTLKAPGWSEDHAAKWLRMNELHLFPELGGLPLDAVKTHILLATLRKVEARGTLSTAQDLQQMAGQVFRYGVQSGKCTINPATDLKGALAPHVARHRAAVLEPLRVGELLRAIDGYHGQPATRAALRLAALLFQRPGNIRTMEWCEVDMGAALWTIPSGKMKRTKAEKLNGRPHLVPLALQALGILAELRPLTGAGRYVFPGARSHARPMSDNTLNAALRRLDFGTDEHVAHGFRAMARTLMVERLPGVSPDVIEAQLAHGKAGPLGMAYDRAEFLEQRRQMMQQWADYLDRLRDGAQVLAFRAA
ncbi:MAG: hypothetical protein RLZZ584_3994 [Pseudomonadota bacterium]|jgi:integrase